MLTAYKERLKRLASDPKDPFQLEIRKRAGKRATLILNARLKKFILLTPGILARTYDALDRWPLPSAVKRLGGYLLTYMYHPRDFLPEDTHGLFGYLDDAYFAAGVYERLALESEKAGRSLNRQDQDLLDQIRKEVPLVKRLLPKEAKAIETLLESIVSGRDDSFQKLF